MADRKKVADKDGAHRTNRVTVEPGYFLAPGYEFAETDPEIGDTGRVKVLRIRPSDEQSRASIHPLFRRPRLATSCPMSNRTRRASLVAGMTGRRSVWISTWSTGTTIRPTSVSCPTGTTRTSLRDPGGDSMRSSSAATRSTSSSGASSRSRLVSGPGCGGISGRAHDGGRSPHQDPRADHLGHPAGESAADRTGALSKSRPHSAFCEPYDQPS